jgi:hypothetical protein
MSSLIPGLFHVEQTSKEESLEMTDYIIYYLQSIEKAGLQLWKIGKN